MTRFNQFIAFIIALAILSITNGTQAQKKSFVSNDIFQTKYFIENKGQFNHYTEQHYAEHIKQIDFVLHNGTDEVYINAEGFQFHMLEQRIVERENKEGHMRKTTQLVKDDWFALKWMNANQQPTFKSKEKSGHYFTYGAKEMLSYGYKSVTYYDLYPGIDVEYKTHLKGGIEYVLYVAPGADLSLVKFKYASRHKVTTTIDKDRIILQNSTGKLVESGIKAFYKNGEPIDIEYKKQGNTISFNPLQEVDKRRSFVIDPWVTAATALTGSSVITTRGYDVDYDAQGNLLVMGGGGGSNSVTNAPKIAKYDLTGNLLWVFSGNIVAPNWNSAPFPPTLFLVWTGLIGNFLVDKSNSKVYMSQGDNPGGATIVRLNSLGIYDNFISIADPMFEEIWEMKYNCNTGSLLAFGGGTNSNLSFGIINSSTGIVSTSNFTGLPDTSQDIACATLDTNGEVYSIFSSTPSPNPVSNRIYKLDQTYTSLWNTPSGYLTLIEAANRFSNYASFGNGMNCLSVNNSYLYYYDGMNLKAFDKNNGATVGIPYNNGLTNRRQYGIYANDCNEVYVGMDSGRIHKFLFNGNNFILQDSLIITGFPNEETYDIDHNPVTNEIIVSGGGFVASLNPKSTCGNISLSYNLHCPDSATVTVTNATLGDAYTFIWTDSNSNTTLSNTAPGVGVFTHGIGGLIPGNTIQVSVLKGSTCQYTSNDTSFILICYATTINRIVCPGDTIHIGSQIVSAPGVYLDTFTNSMNQDSIVATYLTNHPTYNIIVDTSICQGQMYTLPDNTTTATAGNYIFNLTTSNGCDSIITVNLLVHPVYNFVVYDTLCDNQTFTLPDNTVITQSGTYQSNLQSQFACDSNYTNHVFFKQSAQQTENVTICYGATYLLPNGLTVNASGTYNSTFIAANGCDSIITTNLTVRSQNVTNISASICSSDNYTLPNNTTTNVAGIYRDTLVDATACDSIIITDLKVTQEPYLDLGNDTALCNGGLIVLDATIAGATSYLWQDLSTQPTLQAQQEGTYYITVNTLPCNPVSDTIHIFSCHCDFYIPNAFTPNGDNKNDQFKPYIRCNLPVTDYKLNVFNRWGQLVFSTNDLSQGWDGTLNGEPQPIGSYFYTATFLNPELNQPELLRGDITLLR